MQKNKIEIIEGVVEYYSKNPRAKDDTKACTYLNEAGHMCAHSIHLRDDMDRSHIRGIASMVIHAYGDEIHKPEYRGHPSKFWEDIQKLHDDDGFWDDNKLTLEGECFVDCLKREWADNQ